MSEENKEVIDSTTNEEVETTEEVDETPEGEGNELTEREKQFLARAKKAEAKLKETKTEPKPANKPNETQSSLSREEAILIAKGHTEEEVELANKLSKINGTSLLEAVEDDIFKAKVDTRVKSEQDKIASLGVSKGAKGGKAPKPYKEMTEEERIAQFNETMGN